MGVMDKPIAVNGNGRKGKSGDEDGNGLKWQGLWKNIVF
jgi:hypothetical protein